MSSSSNTKTALTIMWLLPLLASIVAITPLAIDLYLPAMPIIAEQYDTTIAAVQNSLSVYLGGYALGMLIFGPLADKLGRRRLAILGLSGFALVSLYIPFSASINEFIILRGIQAFLGSAATVVVPGIIREVYGKNTAKGMSYVSMIMMFAPMLAPTIGSFIMYIDSWQSMFYFLFGYAFVILLFAIKYLPETQTSNKSELSILASYKTVLLEKSAQKNILTSMLVSLSFFSYLTAIPFVYLVIYETTEFVFSFLFGINVVALMTAQFINSRYVVRYGSPHMLKYGFYCAFTSAILLVSVNALEMSLFWTVITILPVMGSMSLIAVNADALILIQFKQQSGTATAVIGTLRFGIGALAGPILAAFHNGTAMPFTLLMLTAIVLVGLCQYSNITAKH
ncbi:multidrug effflux MFS transporter [Thalassomonas sp. M1454]|uniref:multidrug effflux MFS transporter n=1 Tax=Thalassomonas sp. M1454 TaxID=2594477 RepID=UPI00117F4FE1|nr:multidrug effflux MFS transporter [Thalassomonas sp. M1454]TRX53136.1 multidrug effflux MFS transporter [Thalassomonas sp. M1454]